jgi:hypothetical protein
MAPDEGVTRERRRGDDAGAREGGGEAACHHWRRFPSEGVKRQPSGARLRKNMNPPWGIVERSNVLDGLDVVVEAFHRLDEFRGATMHLAQDRWPILRQESTHALYGFDLGSFDVDLEHGGGR